MTDSVRELIAAGRSEWTTDECPACGVSVGREYPLPTHLREDCDAFDD